jgi:hypothetical protein
MNGTVIDPTTVSVHDRWSGNLGEGEHPCAALNGQSMPLEEAGLCAQHWKAGEIQYNASYQVLLNDITALELIPGAIGALPEISVRAVTSNEATVDVNGDGEIWVGNEQTSETPDLWGQFNLSFEACARSACDPSDGGRIVFMADGSALINAMYDYEGFNDGAYGSTNKTIPQNDNRKWAMDFIAEALMSSDPDEIGQVSPTAMVIFDESRHPQNALLADSYNTVYFLLVYFTGEGLAMLSCSWCSSSPSKQCCSRSVTQNHGDTSSASSTTDLVMPIATPTMRRARRFGRYFCPRSVIKTG